MRISIGKYNIESENGFSSEKEAIQFIQDRYPELDSEEIKKKIKPLVKNADKSRNVSKKNTEGSAVSTETDTKGIKEPEACINKSR